MESDHKCGRLTLTMTVPVFPSYAMRFGRTLRCVSSWAHSTWRHFAILGFLHSQSDFPGAPWNKKKTKKEAIPVRASDFTITPGFFQHEDGTPALQLPQLRAQACGVCILDPAQAVDWLKGNNAISSDELGAFILGQLPCETKLPVTPVTAPCLNSNGQSVLLSGRFVQFGSKVIQFCKGSQADVQPENCQMLSITMQREDWPDEDWNQAVAKPIVFIRNILAADQLDKALIAIWGKSLRQGRSPSSPHNASSLQVRCTVASAAVDTILRQSGFNKLYMTPKEPSGRLDLNFNIVWIPGTLAEVTATSARTRDCLGLIRGKQTFGLRFRAEKYDSAWEQVFPGTQPPVKPKGDLLFKISGLPFGCTSGVIETGGRPNLGRYQQSRHWALKHGLLKAPTIPKMAFQCLTQLLCLSSFFHHVTKPLFRSSLDPGLSIQMLIPFPCKTHGLIGLGHVPTHQRLIMLLRSQLAKSQAPLKIASRLRMIPSLPFVLNCRTLPPSMISSANLLNIVSSRLRFVRRKTLHRCRLT